MVHNDEPCLSICQRERLISKLVYNGFLNYLDVDTYSDQRLDLCEECE